MNGPMNPVTSVAAASRIGANRNPIGGSGHSVTGLNSPSASFLRANAPHMNRMAYAAVSALPITMPMSATHAQADPPVAASSIAVSVASFARKPKNGGTPAIDAAAISDTTTSVGDCRAMPLSLSMSRVPS